MQNPQLTDIRLAGATELEDPDSSLRLPLRWYRVVYLAND